VNIGSGIRPRPRGLNHILIKCNVIDMNPDRTTDSEPKPTPGNDCPECTHDARTGEALAGHMQTQHKK
jgi:hypothetical protein